MAHIVIMRAGVCGMLAANEARASLREEQRLTVVSAAGVKLAFDEVPGSGPVVGDTHSVCSVDHVAQWRPDYQASLKDPGLIAVGAMSGASCLSPAYEFGSIISADSRRRRSRNRVPMTFLTSEPHIGQPGLAGAGDSKSALESELRDREIHWITNARTTRVEPGRLFVTELDDQGAPRKDHEVPFRLSMMLPAFKEVDAVAGVQRPCSARGFVLIDAPQPGKKFANIIAAGVCVAIPLVDATSVLTGTRSRATVRPFGKKRRNRHVILESGPHDHGRLHPRFDRAGRVSEPAPSELVLALVHGVRGCQPAAKRRPPLVPAGTHPAPAGRTPGRELWHPLVPGLSTLSRHGSDRARERREMSSERGNRMARFRFVVACALVAATLLPRFGQAQDLLTIWRAAAAHDPVLDVANAERLATETLRDQAAALGRPRVGVTLATGLGAEDSTMRNARFSAPAFGEFDGARFSTSVHGGLQTQIGIAAHQPLIDAERDAQQAALRLSANAGGIAWHRARTDLMLATAERYFALGLAQERVAVTQQLVAALTEARAKAHERYRVGSAPITDTHEADAALATAEARLSAARLDVSTRTRALADSTGLARPHARTPGLIVSDVQPWPYWEHSVLDGNTQLRLLAQALAISEQKLREQQVAGRPKVDLVARATHDRLAGRGDFGEASTRRVNAMVGVQVTIPLGVDGMREARAREAVHRREKARAELDLARQRVTQQAFAAWDGLRANVTRLSALSQGAVASAARLDATQLGYEVGDRTMLDVLDAQNAHAESRLALAEARSNQALLRLQLAALADQLDESLLAAVDTAPIPEAARPEARHRP